MDRRWRRRALRNHRFYPRWLRRRYRRLLEDRWLGCGLRGRPLRRRLRRFRDIPLEHEIRPFEFDPLVRAHLGRGRPERRRLGRGRLELGYGFEVEVRRIELLTDRRRLGTGCLDLAKIRDRGLETLQHAASIPPAPARRLVDETGRLDLQRFVRLGL